MNDRRFKRIFGPNLNLADYEEFVRESPVPQEFTELVAPVDIDELAKLADFDIASFSSLDDSGLAKVRDMLATIRGFENVKVDDIRGMDASSLQSFLEVVKSLDSLEGTNGRNEDLLTALTLAEAQKWPEWHGLDEGRQKEFLARIQAAEPVSMTQEQREQYLASLPRWERRELEARAEVRWFLGRLTPEQLGELLAGVEAQFDAEEVLAKATSPGARALTEQHLHLLRKACASPAGVPLDIDVGPVRSALDEMLAGRVALRARKTRALVAAADKLGPAKAEEAAEQERERAMRRELSKLAELKAAHDRELRRTLLKQGWSETRISETFAQIEAMAAKIVEEKEQSGMLYAEYAGLSNVKPHTSSTTPDAPPDDTDDEMPGGSSRWTYDDDEDGGMRRDPTLPKMVDEQWSQTGPFVKGSKLRVKVSMDNSDLAMRRLQRVTMMEGLEEKEKDQEVYLKPSARRVKMMEDRVRRRAKRSLRRKIKWFQERKERGY